MLLSTSFSKKYKWRIKQSFEHFPDYNDRIDDGCHIAMMLNTNMMKSSSTISLGIPKPPNVSNVMFESVYKDFNKRHYNVSSFPSNYNFDYEMFKSITIKTPPSVKSRCRLIAIIHHINDDEHIPTLQRIFVYDAYYPTPPLAPENANIFGELFGKI